MSSDLRAWAPQIEEQMALHRHWYRSHGMDHGLYTSCVHAGPRMSGRQSLCKPAHAWCM